VLLVNRGDGTFAEMGRQAGVEASGWSWSVLFTDVDLDGFEDLLVANGHRWDLMDADAQERLKSTMTGTNWREERKFYPSLGLKDVAYRNRGDLTFEDASAIWRFGLEDDVSHGMAVGDLDGDGDPDVVINRLDAEALVLRNDAAAPRVLVELVGTAPNRAGVGATISVSGTGPRQSREVSLGGLYLSSSAPAIGFAAPGDSVEIVVRWRGGRETRIQNGRAGRHYQIREARAVVSPPPPAPVPLVPLFEDVSSRIDHQHSDRYFDDFLRQPLLINQLSQLGPGVSWADFDGDGDDDLAIGAGAGGQLGLFRNDRGKFRAVPGGIRADSFDLAAIVGPAKPGPGRSPVLLVGQSSYEAITPGSAVAAPGVLAGAAGAGRAEAVVPGDTTSVGPLALADVDGDGDLDLFVGGRVAPGVYPVPGNSRLFRADTGGFAIDEANRPVLRGIGMVSGAVFSDLDLDGDPDLVLAVDWGPLKILINEAGRLVDRTEGWGLDRLTGRWNGVTAGDFDGDGRLDLIATNWGRNTGVPVDSLHPLYLYFGAWDGDGRVAMSLATFDPRVNGITLQVTLARLTAVVTDQRRRTPTFASYADATADRALGELRAKTARHTATTLDHMVFLNRGGRFEARPLPAMTQVAPAFGVTVADFDGNGAEDVFIGHNFSATNIATPSHNAARGAVLLGDGDGGFRTVSGMESGVSLIADQRGAAVADFDGDGRTDLVVGQNAAPTKLFRNTGGRSGVTVRYRDPSRAAGVVLRLKYRDGTMGPAREIHLGSGYWSQDGLSQVLGRKAGLVAVVVKSRDGRVTELPIAEGQQVVTVP
jgi:hypothetical protein